MGVCEGLVLLGVAYAIYWLFFKDKKTTVVVVEDDESNGYYG